MKYLIISDIHGNLPALEKVISMEQVEGYLMLGDVVNYGPWSNECVDLIDSLPHCTSLIGNHEEYFIQKACNVKNEIVQSFFHQCIESFDRFEKISQYQKQVNFFNFIGVHTIEDKYIFHDTDILLDNNYIIGHSHQQFIRHENNHTIVNPGSVGQNRKYINVINYALFDSENNTFELKQTKYNINLLLDKMKIDGYPQACIDYYKSKQILN